MNNAIASLAQKHRPPQQHNARHPRQGSRHWRCLPGLLLVAFLTSGSLIAQDSRPADTQPASQPAERHATVAYLRMEGEVRETRPDFSLFAEDDGETLKEWLETLAAVRNNEAVDLVAIKLDGLRLNWSQAQELADAVARLNEQKHVYTYITDPGPMSYLVASAGDHVSLEPTSGLNIVGLAGEAMFFRGALDWLGVTPQFIQIGRFKGAAEPMMNTEPSAELIAEHDKILDDLYAQLCEQIARQRGLDVEAVRASIDQGPLTAEEALHAGWVDELVERDDWFGTLYKREEITDATVRYQSVGKTRPEMDFSNPFAMFKLLMGGTGRTATPENTVAIIVAEGMIVCGDSTVGPFGQPFVGAETMRTCFREAARDDRIKGVLFRIDSPGGSALASELIFQAARDCAAKKPVVVSISNLGASGGYYIAMAGERMYADPAAIVGSIGVITGKLATQGLLEKLHIHTHEFTRGANAGIRTTSPLDDAELAVLQSHGQRVYETFTQRVAEGRGEKIPDIAAVAQGRVFTARQAKDNGLIDELGGLHAAAGYLLQQIGLENPHYLLLPRPKTLADLLAGDKTGVRAAPPQTAPAAQTVLKQLLGADLAATRLDGVRYLWALARLLGREQTLAASPTYLHIRY